MILIVEDSKIQRSRLKSSLEGAGFPVMEAENGQEALKLISTSSPTAIVTDLLMPVMDGVEMIEELKRLNCAIPILVITADIQETTKKKCQDLGVVAFVNKPPKAEQYIPILRQLIGE